MDKESYITNAMNRFSSLNRIAINKKIEIDYDKIRWLTEEWLEHNKMVDRTMFDEFCNNIEDIIREEIFLRENRNSQKCIWLTK